MRYFFFVLLCLSFLFVPDKVHSQESGGISVSPAYIDVEVEDPDARENFEVTYKNNSSESVELEIFSIDFHQTNENGVIGFLGQDSGSYEYGLSSFLSFETNNLQIEPNESKSLVATVSNRQDLSPGGHYAAVIARLASDEEDVSATSSAVSTKIAPAASSLVYLVKRGGEHYNLSLKESNWPNFPIVFDVPSTVALTFQNRGNVHVAPFGTISIKDMFGREVRKGTMNSSSHRILPTSIRVVPGYLNDLAPLMPFSFMNMEIKGSDFDENANFVLRESFIYVNPLVLILPILAIILFVFIKKKKRKKRKSDK